MIVVIVLALIKGVQTFDEVFVLTGGGPGTATLMVVQYIYETAFSNQVQNFGLAAAASVVLGVVLFVLTLLQLAVARRKEADMAAMRLGSLLRQRRRRTRPAAALDRYRSLRLSRARRRADVRPGALAGAVVVQDPERACWNFRRRCCRSQQVR